MSSVIKKVGKVLKGAVKSAVKFVKKAAPYIVLAAAIWFTGGAAGMWVMPAWSGVGTVVAGETVLGGGGMAALGGGMFGTTAAGATAAGAAPAGLIAGKTGGVMASGVGPGSIGAANATLGGATATALPGAAATPQGTSLAAVNPSTTGLGTPSMVADPTVVDAAATLNADLQTMAPSVARENSIARAQAMSSPGVTGTELPAAKQGLLAQAKAAGKGAVGWVEDHPILTYAGSSLLSNLGGAMGQEKEEGPRNISLAGMTPDGRTWRPGDKDSMGEKRGIPKYGPGGIQLPEEVADAPGVEAAIQSGGTIDPGGLNNAQIAQLNATRDELWQV